MITPSINLITDSCDWIDFTKHNCIWKSSVAYALYSKQRTNNALLLIHLWWKHLLTTTTICSLERRGVGHCLIISIRWLFFFFHYSKSLWCLIWSHGALTIIPFHIINLFSGRTICFFAPPIHFHVVLLSSPSHCLLLCCTKIRSQYRTPLHRFNLLAITTAH